MALTTPPEACAHSSLGRVSVPASATHSRSSLEHFPPSPPRSARPCAHSSTPCSTGHASAKACACALGQRLRHFVDHVTATVGAANSARVRHWFQKKTGRYAVLADPPMPVTIGFQIKIREASMLLCPLCRGFHSSAP